MKILIITPTYAPAWKFGGTVAAMTQLAHALNSHENSSVTVYTTNASAEERKLDVDVGVPIEVEGVTTFYFDCGRWNNSGYYSVDMMKSLEGNIHQFDIVYISAIWQFLGYKSARICIKNEIPYVMGIHGSFSKELRQKSKFKKTLYHQLLLKPILKKAKAVHVTGEQEIKDSGGWLDKYVSIKVPNIINSEKYYVIDNSSIKQKFKKNYHIPEQSKIILTVCRPDWMKRVDILLESIKDNDDYYLVYVGNEDSNIVDGWKDKAKDLGINKRFVCTGELRGEDLIIAYNSADLFSLISSNENFSMVVVEALLCGTPTLISKEVGVGEYMKNNAYVVITNLNKEQISFELNKILQKDFRKESIRESILDLFSEEQLASVFIEAFQNIVSKKDKIA